MTTSADREAVRCPHCGANPDEACDFPNGGPWTVVENGVERRVVHAVRYAQTLPQDERAEFWATATERYMSEQLAALSTPEGGTDGQP